MAVSNMSHPGDSWDYFASVSGAITLPRTARSIRIGGTGNLYLIPVGSGVQKLFAGTVLAGEQFDVQFDGIGSSTTCTLITVEY